MAKNFTKSLMASEDIQSLLYTGVYFDADGNKAECPNGALVVKGDMMAHNVYEGLMDPNVYAISAPTSSSDEIGIVDYVDVSYGDIMNVRYREGIKTFGIPVPKGKETRVRVPMKHDTGYFAEGNFESKPTVGQYAVPTEGSTGWTPVAEKATDKTCVKIEFEKATVEGMVNTGTEYFVRFVNVI